VTGAWLGQKATTTRQPDEGASVLLDALRGPWSNHDGASRPIPLDALASARGFRNDAF